MSFPIYLPTKVIYAGKHNTLLRARIVDDQDQPDTMPGWTLWRAMWRPSREDVDNGISLIATLTGNLLTVEVDEATAEAIGCRGGVWDVKATGPDGKNEVFFTAETASEGDVTRP